jgi:hypothetical protein
VTLLDSGRQQRGGHRFVAVNVWQDDAWLRSIRQVQGWLREPPILEDGETPPTALVIDTFMRMIDSQQARMPAPTRVMPNGEGGLVVEWISGTRTMVIEISEDLSLEFTVLDQGVRLQRETLRQPSPNQYFYLSC